MLRAALAILLLAGMAARAEDRRIGVRSAEHPGRSRLVLDWPAATPAYQAEHQGDRLLLRLPAEIAPRDVPRRLPRQVQGMALTPEGLVLTLRPGVRVRHFTLDRRVVLDLTEGEAPAAEERPRREAPAARATPQAPTARAAPEPPTARTAPEVLRPPRPGRPTPPAPEPVLTAAPRPMPEQQELPPPPGRAATVARAEPTPPAVAPAPPVLPPPPVVAAPEPTPPQPALPPTLPPGGAVALRLLPGAAGQPPELHLPFNDPTAAAVLRRGDALLLAFATTQALDLAGIRSHPLFAPAEATALPGGAVLRLPLSAPAAAQARREGPGWIIRLTRGSPETEPRAMTPEVQPGAQPRLILRAARPGAALALTDPETGLPLLLGTVQEAGQAVPVSRRLAELELPETMLGMAVLARADSVTLSPLNDRFVVAAAGRGALALDLAAATTEPGARSMTRGLDLPPGSASQLLNRLRGQQSGIAAAAPLARAQARREAAETLLALGLGPEAQTMAGLALVEDPASAAEPRLVTVAAAGALLAGRLPEAQPLREAALPASDELTLWRAALAAAENQPREAGPGFAATLPLLLDYPQPLRDRLLAPAAEALAQAGELAALTRLLAAVPAAALPLSRAMLLEAEGKSAEAVAAYAAVAAGKDRRARALALRRSIDLRLARGDLTPAAAAKALDSALFAWRGDEIELAARRRLAELRLLAKQPREALALLDETALAFPEQVATLREARVTALLAALGDEPPLAAVALHDANAELLKDDPRAEEAAATLAERLVALDLTARAATVLARAADRAGEPARRASLGLRLAALKLGEGDAAAALAALEATKAEGLPEPLSRERVTLAARAEARRGNLAQAREALQTLGDAGVGPLAELLAEAQDWPGAAAAGTRLLAMLPPAPATLDAAQQRLVLRQAAMLALAGDEAGLAALRAYAPRLPEGPVAQSFSALTADGLRGLADLPRLAREQQLFRNLPRRLEALRAGAPVTR